jgi:GWxTD domain-containing protein
MTKVTMEKMSIRNRISFYGITAACVLFLLMIQSCGGPKRISNQNLAYRYSPGINFIFPAYRVYNITPDTTRVFFHINPSELLFVNTDTLMEFRSAFSISFRLLRSFDSREPSDSGTFFYDYKKNDAEGTRIQDHFDVRTPDSINYLLEVTLSDLNRQQAVVEYMTIYRSGIQSPSDFMIFDAQWNRPIVQKFIDRKTKVRLHHNQDRNQTLYMRYFRNDYPLSPPPFSSVEMKPLSYNADRTTIIDLNENDEILIEQPGIYHFQFDTLIKSGLTLFFFEEDFPNLTSTTSLIESIRYLTTRQEFDKIQNSSNKKEAVDQFWLNLSGNRERGRLLIKSYYSRVQQANIFFTSYTEGWKTDRGLIYIIFGPPTSVYRNNTGESWNYSQTSYHGSLSFTFEKLSNPFTDNDFKLRRSGFYEIPWYKAVDSWREGRVVNDAY